MGASKLLVKLKNLDSENQRELITNAAAVLAGAITTQKNSVVTYLLGREDFSQAAAVDVYLLATKAGDNDAILIKLISNPFMRNALFTHTAPELSFMLASHLDRDKYPEVDQFYEAFPVTQEVFRKACEQQNLNLIRSLLSSKRKNNLTTLLDNVVFKLAIDNNDWDLLSELLVDFCNHPVLPRQDWLLKPMCYIKDKNLRGVIRALASIFKHNNIKAYLYGSGLYLADPNDIDYLVDVSEHPVADEAKITQILEQLEENGASILKGKVTDHPSSRVPRGISMMLHGARDDVRCEQLQGKYNCYGYKTKDRYVIPLQWQGVKIEFILLPLTYQEHAPKLDITLGACYFDSSLTMLSIKHIDACADLANKLIRTIKDPHLSFQEDPSRIFRVVRLRAKSDFEFVDECRQTLIEQGIDPYQNLFLKMNHDKLCQQLTLLINAKSASDNIKLLLELNLLDKILYAFNYSIYQGEAALVIRPQLTTLIDQTIGSMQREKEIEATKPSLPLDQKDMTFLSAKHKETNAQISTIAPTPLTNRLFSPPKCRGVAVPLQKNEVTSYPRHCEP